MKTRRSIVVTTVLAALALAAAGCTTPGQPAAPTEPPSTSSSPSNREVAEAAAMAAYSNMWQAMARAGTAQDPDDPQLRQYATGDALARVVGALASYKHSDLVLQGFPINNPSVESATPADSPTEIHLVDCTDSTGWTTHHRDTGVQVTPDPRGRRTITAVVVLMDGIWKVSTFDIQEIGSC